MNDINISSNWVTVDGTNLSKIITCSSSKQDRWNIDDITVDSCVCLTSPDKTEESASETNVKPELEITAKKPLKEISVLSEASLIEVFGECNEYLFTSNSEFIDDSEGMAMYQSHIVLPNVTKCKFKFTKLKEPNRLWIYGVSISVLETSEALSQVKFNIGNVDKLIQESSHQLSERAKKFKSFFEMYLKNSSQLGKFDSPPNGFENFFNIIWSQNQLVGAEKGDCNDLKKQNEANSSDQSAVAASNCDSSEYLKKYIDESLNKIKEDIVRSVEVKLNEFMDMTDAKLEKIIQTLDRLNV